MSNVRTDIPPAGVASTDDLRQNFITIKQELEVLQAFMASAKLSDSPIMTGTFQAVNGVMSGSLTIAGTFAPTSESYVASSAPNLTPGGNISSIGYDFSFGPIKFYKDAKGEVTVCGSLTPTWSSGGVGQIAAIGALPSVFCNPSSALTIPVAGFLNNTMYALIINPLGQIQMYSSGSGAAQLFLSGKYRPTT